MTEHIPFTTLPVWGKKAVISERIREAQATVLRSSTSSGKSVLLGPILAELGYKTLIAVPRIDLAERLSEAVSKFYGFPVGTRAGYHTGDTSCWDRENTEILFCTDGSLQLILQLLSDNRFDVLVLDEFHLRNSYQDLLAAITIKGWKDRRLCHKLVLLSATIDSQPIKSHFERSLGRSFPFTELTLTGRRFAVKDREPRMNTESQEAAYLAVHESRNVLLFVAGQSDVFKAVRDIEELVGNRVVVLPFFRRLSAERKALIYKEYPKPLIIVATDIAAAGFNPGQRNFSVVDSGLRKTDYINSKGLRMLKLEAITADEEEQRRGRAGRSCANDVYISFRNINISWLNLIDKNAVEPQIRRSTFHNQYLDLLTLGIDLEKLPLIGRISQERFTTTRSYLLTLGCIRQKAPTAVEPTSLGTLVAALPVDVRGAIAIAQAIHEHVLYDMIRIIALHEVGGVCNHDGPWNVGESFSALVDQYDAYRWWYSSNPEERSRHRFEDVSLKEVEHLVQRIEVALARLHIEVDPLHQYDCNSDNWKVSVRRCLCRAFIDTCFIAPRDVTASPQSRKSSETTKAIKLVWNEKETMLRNRRLISSLKPSTIVVGEVALARDNTEVLKSATIVDPAWLLEFGAELYGGVFESTPYLSPDGQPVRDKTGELHGRTLRVKGIPCSYQELPPVERAQWFSLQHKRYEETGEVGTDKAGRIIELNSKTFTKGKTLQSALQDNVFELPTCWAEWYLEQFEQGNDLPLLSLDEEWVKFLS